MTFILAIEPFNPDVEPDHERAMRFIRLRIGIDPNQGHVYWLIVQLDILPGAGDELSFWIEAESENGNIEQYRDGQRTRFLDRYASSQIILILMDAIRNLLEHCKPDHVILITGQFRLPDKALVKFAKIVEIFEDSGYKLEHTGISLGVRSWQFKMNPRVNP